ncbi:MAG: hypoxanthine phosphoribosyltransferase [Candidatus Zixiibacteriota bacterium]
MAKNYKLVKLISKEEIESKVDKLAKQISKDYKGKNPVIVPILKGSFIFAADLCRKLDIDFTIDFLSVMSYGESTKSSGVVQMVKDLETDIQGKHVILVEDIFDSGLTLEYLDEYFHIRKPASLETACLLIKDVKRTVALKPKYSGFDIEDKFVVGYGLDFAQKHRGLSHIAKVEFND